jgi:phenylacetate-CoA ligase
MNSCFDPWLTSAFLVDAALAAQSTPEGLAARRERRWQELRDAARRGSSWYRDRLRPESPWQSVEPSTKGELMAHFDAWVTDPRLNLQTLREFLLDPSKIGQAHMGDFTVWESSGTSGQPGIFVQDSRAMAVYDALEAGRRPARWLDPWYVDERLALVAATGGHFASVASAQRLRTLNPAMSRNLHLLSFLQPISELANELNRLQPTIIASYPTMLAVLAHEQSQGRLHITPRELWTGGETLTPTLREHICSQFGCSLVDSYGASEFLSIACSSCRFGVLHLNSDWVVLEPVDEHRRALPAGTVGHTTLLTNLANHVQPVIRYDIGDRVCVHERRCECGSPLPVIDVEGRMDDTLAIRGDDDHDILIAPLALTTILEDDAGVFDFRLVQRAGRSLRLSVGGDVRAAARARAALHSFLRRQGAGKVRISAHSESPSARGRSGKLQRVVVLSGSVKRDRATVSR